MEGYVGVSAGIVVLYVVLSFFEESTCYEVDGC
jgi:hypothetical protein